MLQYLPPKTIDVEQKLMECNFMNKVVVQKKKDHIKEQKTRKNIEKDILPKSFSVALTTTWELLSRGTFVCWKQSSYNYLYAENSCTNSFMHNITNSCSFMILNFFHDRYDRNSLQSRNFINIHNSRLWRIKIIK